MGTTPKIKKKPKYNNKDAFRWVDSQWEKFMTEQKELKFRISELEHHSEVAEDYITELEEENKIIKEDIVDLIKRTPSKFLFESKQSDYSKPDWTPKQIEYWDKMIKESIKHTQREQTKHKIEWKDVERSDEWRIEQFNRNRAVEDQVSSVKEIDDRVSEIFGEALKKKKYIYESPDGGKTLYRREFNKYDSKENINE